MTTPTEDAWRALARSSPWRWRSAELTVRRRRVGCPETTVHAWLRKPGDVRIEADHEVGPDGGRVFTARDQGQGPQPQDRPATFRADGLVATREPVLAGDDHGLYYEDYGWLAILDPLELADGARWEDEGATGPLAVPGTTLTDLVSAARAGRETWWATAAPTADYEPRCGCCALLYGEIAERGEYGDSAPRRDDPAFAYTTRWLVGLDAASGICVSLEFLDGSMRGLGHEVEIHALDEPYPDRIFARS